MAVTSNVGNRGRALGVVVAVAMVGALLSAQTAFGAGDPIASGTFKLKLSKGFKKQLKRNHVRMKPRKFKIKQGSSVDPTTGASTLRIGKIKFKKGHRKVVYNNTKVTIGASGGKGAVKGTSGKLFKLRGGSVTRDGFGATVSGVKAKFLAAKKINRKLKLHSLHKGKAGSISVAEQPKTVGVTGGFVFVVIPNGYLPTNPVGGPNTDPNTLAAKQPAHCIGPADGVVVIPGDPNNPALQSTALSADPVLGPPPTGDAAEFRFPVTGGTVGPDGKDGVVQVSGGVRIMSGYSPLDTFAFGAGPSDCATNTPSPTASNSILDTTDLAPNLDQLNIQAQTFIRGTTPGCNGTGAACGPLVFGGDKGIAIGQTIDASGVAVSADPTAHTVTVNGGLIKNNATATLVLNGLFPNASGDSSKDFVDGDKFGISTLNVTTR